MGLSSARDIEDTEDVEAARLVRMFEASTVSNIGELDPVLLEELMSSVAVFSLPSSSSCSIPSIFLKCPPCIGGKKLFHLP